VPYKLIKNHNIGGTSKILGWVVADHEVISLQNQLPDNVAVILGNEKAFRRFVKAAMELKNAVSIRPAAAGRNYIRPARPVKHGNGLE